MKILIVGLGMIGASYAKGLIEKGHTIFGVTRTIESLNKAKQWGIINEGSLDAKDYIEKADLIVVCLYPRDIMKFIENNNDLFKKGQIITDVAGTKIYVNEIQKILKNAEFIGSHPMAGSEKSGIDAINPKIFNGANFLITPNNNTKYAIETIKQIAKDLNFGKITIMDPQKHDEVIAFTSQLTHAIAVALVNSDNNIDTPRHTGDSYRELTRIAMINEMLWSELFLENKNNLIKEIEKFEKELEKIKKSLLEDDQESLKQLMISSREKRKRF